MSSNPGEVEALHIADGTSTTEVRSTEVCSVCYHEPEFDDAEVCLQHPNAPTVTVTKPLPSAMRQDAQQTEPPLIVARRRAPVSVTRRTKSFATATRGPVGVTRQTKPFIAAYQDAPIGAAQQTAPPAITALQDSPIGVARQIDPPPSPRTVSRGGLSRSPSPSTRKSSLASRGQSEQTHVAHQGAASVGVERPTVPTPDAPVGVTRQTDPLPSPRAGTGPSASRGRPSRSPRTKARPSVSRGRPEPTAAAHQDIGVARPVEPTLDTPIGIARPIELTPDAPVGVARPIVPTLDAPVGIADASIGVARRPELTPNTPISLAQPIEPAHVAAYSFQTFLPILGGCMPQTAQLCQRNEWVACRRRLGLPVTADMDPSTTPARR